MDSPVEGALLSDDEELGQRSFTSARKPAWRRGTMILLAVSAVAAVVMLAPRAIARGASAQMGKETIGFAENASSESVASEVASEDDVAADADDSADASAADDAAEEALEEKADVGTNGSAPEDDASPPCKTAHVDDSPSFFCWAVMFPDDKALITSTFEGRAGIFACNDYTIISEEDAVLGKDDCGVEVKTLQTEFPEVKKGMYGVDGSMTSSWLNVPIFIICWDLVIEGGKVWERDFTVKLDPDAVFFPQRLGVQLKDHVGNPIYTTDCRYWGGDPVGKVFGAIEVVSKEAVGAYKGNVDTCKNLPWQGWGEDYWLQHCFKEIGIDSVILADYVTDNTCPEGGGGDCGDPKFIALHPHKDAGDWWDCWKQSNPE